MSALTLDAASEERSYRWKNALAVLGKFAVSFPALFLIIALFIYPFIGSFIDSFRVDGLDALTLQNYEEVFKYYGRDIGYTLIISFVSLALILLLTAVICGYLRLYANGLMEVLFTFPLFVPFVVVGHAMRIFLAPHGTLNSALSFLKILDPDTMPNLAFSSFGLIAAFVWKSLGLSVLLVLGATRGIHEDYLDAARALGAKSWRLVVHFIVPMVKGTFGVVAILTITQMFGNFSIPAMIGSGGGPTMIMLNLYDAINTRLDYGVAGVFGVISYVFSLGAAVYYLRTLRRR